MFKKAFYFISLLVIAFLFFLPKLNLFAQEEIATSLGLSISPAHFELMAQPGDLIKNNKLMLYNPGDQAIEAVITVEDFLPYGEEGQVQIVEPDLQRSTSLASWIKLKNDQIEIKPREQKIIEFDIEVPNQAEPGGKYSTVVINIGKDASVDQAGGAAMKQKIASLVLLSVAGQIEENLVIKKFVGPNFQEYGPVNFSLYLENMGTVHLRPRGFVTITDWRQKKIVDLPIPQSAVIPGARRIINLSWNEKNIVGRFQATVVGTCGSTNEPISATLTFWVWPWKLSILILIILLGLLIILIRGRKRIGAALKILFKGEGSKNSQLTEKQNLSQAEINQSATPLTGEQKSEQIDNQPK